MRYGPPLVVALALVACGYAPATNAGSRSPPRSKAPTTEKPSQSGPRSKAPKTESPTQPGQRLFAASNEGQCLAGESVNGFLRAHGANVLRVILSPWWATNGASLTCIQAASAAHYKIYLSLQFSNRWTLQEDAAYFAQVLPTFAPYLWALSVGNEQDLPAIVLPGQRPRGLNGKNYRAVWDAVEPVMARLAPHAIRVYGEFTPWAFAANRQGFARGRPRGVQAIAAHCYHTKVGGLMRIPALAAWAASERLPLWCSEMGPALPTKTTPPWVVPQNQAAWNRSVARVMARSPDLKMTSYYYAPGF